MTEMAYSEVNNGIKQEQTTHFHDLLHAQLSAEDSRNNDNNDSAEESGESPLDFSIKRKPTSYDEVSGSDSLSSPASSFNDTGGHLEDRKSDTDGGSINKSSSSQESPPDSSPLFHHKQFKNEQLRHEISPVHERIGRPKPGDTSGIPSMFHEQLLGLANANMLNSFPAMAALMDPRRLSAVSKMGTRPFKAYPNHSLSLPSEVGAIPDYLTSFANFENSALMQGLNLSSEEMFNVYKQQLLTIREREKYLENMKISTENGGGRTTSAATSSPSASLPSSLSSIHLATTMAARNNGINNNHFFGLTAGTKPSSGPPSTASTFSNFSNSSKNDNTDRLTHSPTLSSLTASGRRRPRSLPDEQKDDAYWERRRKNNEAAKRSRDTRRAKEDQIAIRAALLEQENLKLRVEVAALKTETAKLRCMLYNS
ncbi:protein giant-like [Mya arenaria]|uniref:protein giant-like n=1 Tax=Mya arenaria TaxID=6604 RepID=UPI0022E63C6D|nr:protein giant-like [Mya arenaria]